MKKTISAVLALALVLTMALPSFAFTDVSGEALTDAVYALQSMGLAEGTGDGNYSPDKVLTRAQFCTFIIKAKGLEQKTLTVGEKLLFTDVKPGSWYTGYVNLAYSEGIVQGRGNGKFGPDDALKYDETVTMLLRLLGYTSEEIGNSWPEDYVNYAHYLELDEGLSLSAKSVVTRGQAAQLLYNALKTVPNHGSTEFYKTLKDVATVETGIVLESDCSDSGKEGQLKAFLPSSGKIVYYEKENTVSSAFESSVADLLTDRSGKLIGLVTTDKKDESLVISSADLSGITGSGGESIRIPSSAKLIYGSDIYTWTGGYVHADSGAGRTASIYKDDDGSISYVIISAAASEDGADVAVVETNSPFTELRYALGAPADCDITKNNGAADQADLLQGDLAYYDSLTKTLRVCDWTVAGYIEKAEPGITAADTVVVSGCSLEVLDCAKEELAKYSVGSKVILLLTDDLKVGAVSDYDQKADKSVGILAPGGKTITLVGSGLVLSAGEIKADAKLQGQLVTLSYTTDKIVCKALELDAPTRNEELELAPGCCIYDQAGGSWLYSLEGVLGASSQNLDAITWTDRLDNGSVSGCHKNEAGQVDILVLNDVTGNVYTYGACELLTDAEGINLGTMTMAAYNNAATVTNAGGTGGKWLCTLYDLDSDYCGLALRSDKSGYSYVCARAELTKLDKLTEENFVSMDGETYVKQGSTMVAVSESVQIYYKKNDRWESGEKALTAAINSGLPLTVFYDRSGETGGKVRIIELNN